MRALILIPLLLGCAAPPTGISPTEARGLAMLHHLRAMDPCEAGEVRRGRDNQ